MQSVSSAAGMAGLFSDRKLVSQQGTMGHADLLIYHLFLTLIVNSVIPYLSLWDEQ